MWSRPVRGRAVFDERNRRHTVRNHVYAPHVQDWRGIRLFTRRRHRYRRTLALSGHRAQSVNLFERSVGPGPWTIAHQLQYAGGKPLTTLRPIETLVAAGIVFSAVKCGFVK